MKHTHRHALLLVGLALLAGFALNGDHRRIAAPRQVPENANSLANVKQVNGQPVTTVERPGQAPAKAIAGEIVAKVNDPAAFAKLGQTKPAGSPNVYLVSVSPAADLAAETARIAAIPGVAVAGPNYIAHETVTPNDPYYGTYQWSLPKISAPNAWTKTTGTANAVIASLDTGVSLNHPELAPKMWANTAEIPNNGIDDDSNGYVDDANGMDFVNANFVGGKYVNDANGPMDDEGHGSLTSSVMAAGSNNAIGIAGVSWQSKIMAVKVLDDNGFGTFTDIANGIRYAAANGAKVINMSLGAQGVSSDFNTDDAIATATAQGVTIVAASGNDGSATTISYPAINSNVIAVGATNSNDTTASYSNGGPQLSVVAPGSGIIGVDTLLSAPANIHWTLQTDATSTLPPGTYAYYVSAYNAAGETVPDLGTSSGSVSVAQRVKLDWNAVSGATGYKVYRTAANGNSVKLLADAGSATTYTDNGSTALSSTNGPAHNTATLTTSYATASGTSLAAPHVAGVAALIKSLKPQSTPAEVRQAIQGSADKTAGMGGSPRTDAYGYGRLNADRALGDIPANSAQYVRQSANPTINSGQQTTVYVDYKNTGYVSWSSTGPNAIHLGTTGPRDRGSGLYSSDWLSLNRTASFTGTVDANQALTQTTTVNPGETARFQFTITGPPSGAAVIPEYFQPVIEGVGWLEDYGLHWNVSLTGRSYSYAWAGQVNPPTVMQPGQEVTVSYDLQNTGTASWRRNGLFPTHMGTSNPLDRGSGFAKDWLSINRLPNFAGKVINGVVADSDQIDPGEIARYSFTMKAPAQGGNFREYFRPLVEQWGWLADKGMYFPITVQNQSTPTYDYQETAQAAYPIIQHNGTATITLDLRNTGTATWNSAGATPVRLATDRPLDRGSGFSQNGTAAGWLSYNRIHLARNLTDSNKNVSGETTVAPGETGQFQFDVVGAPASGSYPEFFRPVVDGVGPMKDTGIGWVVTVQTPLKVGLAQQNSASFSSTGTVNLKTEDGQLIATIPAGQAFGLTYNGQYVVDKASGQVIVNSPVHAEQDANSIITVNNLADNGAYNRFHGALYIKNGSPGTWLVNEVDLEQYLKGGGEVSDSWPMEAIKAQATAARTYAARKMQSPRNEVFAIYDTTSDQVYNGYNAEAQKPNTATGVAQTAGMVVKYGGALAQTYYYSDSGGGTANNEDVWGGSAIPYLRAVADPWQKPDVWSKTVTNATLQANYGHAGNIDAINILANYAGGRVKTIQLVTNGGSTTNHTELADDHRADLTTRSSLITGLGRSGNDWVITGRGFGHGIGMNQWGAYNQANAGRNYIQILQFYYAGVTVASMG